MLQLQAGLGLQHTEIRLELQGEEGEIVAAEVSDHMGDDEDNPDDVSIIE